MRHYLYDGSRWGYTENPTPELIRATARLDVALNGVPMFNHDLTGPHLELYKAERKAAEIDKAAGAGGDHAAYGWARASYACPECQAAYNKAFDEWKRRAKNA